MTTKYEIRFRRLRIMFWIGLVAVPLMISSRVLGETSFAQALYVASFLFAIPLIVYLYCISILHWKDRYKGAHSDFWGIILLIETSGWFKIIYFFRHMLPDMRQTGRYAIETANQSSEPILKTPVE